MRAGQRTRCRENDATGLDPAGPREKRQILVIVPFEFENPSLVVDEFRVSDEWQEEFRLEGLDRLVHDRMRHTQVSEQCGLVLESFAIGDALKEHAPDRDHDTSAVRAGTTVDEDTPLFRLRFPRDPDELENLS